MVKVKIRKLLPEMENMGKYHNKKGYKEYFKSNPFINVYAVENGLIGQVVFNDNINKLKYDNENIFLESKGITKLKNQQLILIEIAAGAEIALPISSEEARKEILRYNKIELLEEFGLI